MANQEINLIPQEFNISDSAATAKYPNVRRQIRRRLVEIDTQIADLKDRKAKLLARVEEGK